MPEPRLSWDMGTAYDLFVSLDVLHRPSDYGVRGVWAAGMRSRLPAAEREFFEGVIGKVVDELPAGWVYYLPQPKDGAAALRALERTAPADRLPVLLSFSARHTSSMDLLKDIAARGAWDADDLEAYRAACGRNGKHRKERSRAELEQVLDWWARAEEFGERYLKALQAYYEVFFAEEERRIYPALQDALERAQELAEQLSVAELVEELSQGVKLPQMLKVPELVLTPSYWSAPLIYFGNLDEERMLFMFGGRPADAALIPGEVVPEQLLRALKAMSDPTRLKILYYLTGESLTPTQLSHRLRLRAPTVVHHLQALRTAGLVHVTISEGKERSYAIREEALDTVCDSLHSFLGLKGHR